MTDKHYEVMACKFPGCSFKTIYPGWDEIHNPKARYFITSPNDLGIVHITSGKFGLKGQCRPISEEEIYALILAKQNKNMAVHWLKQFFRRLKERLWQRN